MTQLFSMPSSSETRRKATAFLFSGKSLEKSPSGPKVKESYFATCERDDEGHCLPSGQSSEEGGRANEHDEYLRSMIKHDEAPIIEYEELTPAACKASFPKGIHTKKDADEIVKYLNKSTGMKFEVHGSLKKKEKGSDFDILLKNKNGKKTNIEEALGKIGFEYVQSVVPHSETGKRSGGQVDRYYREKSNHEIDVFIPEEISDSDIDEKFLPIIQTKDLKSDQGAPHKYGCLMAILPEDARKTITDWALENIPEFHLGPGGYETRPHITIKYGFEDSGSETIESLKKMLAGVGPIQVRIKGLSLFTGGYGKWINEDGDVLKLDVESPKLHELNSAITAQFPCKDTHPDYVPHITVAYVLPEISYQYDAKPFPLDGQLLTLSELEWSGADGHREMITLSMFPDLSGKPWNDVREQKALSWLDSSRGGALVKPPETTMKKRKASLVFDPEGIKMLKRKYKGNASGAKSARGVESLPQNKGIVSDSVQAAGEWLAKKWINLEQRYGRKAALAMAISMMASMPIPGNIAAVVGIAEAIRGLHGFMTGGKDLGLSFGANKSLVAPVVTAYARLDKGMVWQRKDIKGESYFATCERDDEGHCLPSGQQGQIPKADNPKAPEVTPVKKAAQKGELVKAKREGKGKESRVVLSDGSVAPPHIKPSMIPPAWKNVKISMDPDADVLVQARDAKGNAKTVYHEKYLANNQAAKFAKIQEGLIKFKAIYDQNQGNRKSEDPAIREAADAVWLMQEQATRPGSDADTKGLESLYGLEMKPENITVKRDKKGKPSVILTFGDKKIPIKDEGTKEEIIKRMESGDLMDSTFWLKSHGATTLEDRHVIEAEDGVRLQFVGKEGVWHDHLIRNPKLAEMLLNRKKTAKERGGKLFDTDYDKVSKYSKTLDGGKFTPKDFRTMKATSMAIEEINKRGECCKSPDEYKKAVMEVATKVSNVLGNRPQQCLESYISPAVWSQWREAS